MTAREIPNWETLYDQQSVETMPWYCVGLDPDLAQGLTEQGIVRGNVLDLGTGPGTQALALSEKGFQVTGSDIASGAIGRARVLAERRGLPISFVRDDILATQLPGGYDVVIDRGCFHVLPPEARSTYVENLCRLVRPTGVLFLKCFSDTQPGETGPYRFRPEEIAALFARGFALLGVRRSVYQGALEEFPKALFCTLRRTLAPGVGS